MKNKQLAGIIAAALVILLTGFAGVFSNVYSEKQESRKSRKSGNNSVAEKIVSQLSGDYNLPDGNFIGVLNITGTIQASSKSISASGYDHDKYMDFVNRMEKASNNKGILLYVNSPGGTVYESDEMYTKLMEYKKKTGRPVYAYFANEACSGAYYISMAADKIYANRNTWTGSIGVIISMYNYQKLFEKFGIKEDDIVSGPNKNMGSGGVKMSKEQRKIFQGLVDEAYDQFTGIVAEGRDMDISRVKKLADGRIYTAKQAKENGLIDETGSYDDAQKAMKNDNSISENTEFFTPDSSIRDILSSLYSDAEGLTEKSDRQTALELINDVKNGELLYYAQ